MVSALWKACSDGDVANVQEILKDALVVDIEIKDHTGVTPLIEAVKNGHLEIVGMLLEKGADPLNSSSQGRPQQYTSDLAILDMLNNAVNRISQARSPLQHPGYAHDPNGNPGTPYYSMPPPGPYGYYPAPPMPEGGAQGYYPPPTPAGAEQHWPGAPGNLPPSDIARYIPCRYFPSCRYGASCLFLHPQGPYYQGPPAPAQYPAPYDPMAQQGYSSNYYQMPPPPQSFQSPNGAPLQMNSMSPPAGPHHIPPQPFPMSHSRSGSEVVSPVQGHYPPNGGIPLIPYGSMSPVSAGYSHPPQGPIPLSVPTLSQQQLLPQGPQSPQAVYHNPQAGAPQATHIPPFVVRQDAASYQPQGMNGHNNFPDANGGPKSPTLPPQGDNYTSNHSYREGMGHTRRGSLRRGSFGGSSRGKPACIFFPAGKCKNGEDCRFPHIMPDGPVNHHPGHFASRGGGPRSRGPPSGNGNAFKAIEEKFAALAVQEQEAHAQQNGVTDHSSQSQSSEGGSRPRYSQGAKTNGITNGHKKLPSKQQRVPNADEFPVLAGSTTPPARSPGVHAPLSNGQSGPTAAQVLQAPPPISRRESKQESTTTRSATPELEPKAAAETNGHTVEALPDLPVKKLPISFAAVATAAPEVPKEVSVSA